ncbi:MAG: TIGR00725 family protein [Acidobacteriota bacterium]|nr:TIGR00725 family protein [Acidobacteriota bacterium]MDW3228863.1 TIGR00725 family protein [Acidobacteriota bacterium]MDY0231060.1 TIGR00725 family protein [Candidatus Saccharicenans sp.]
MKAKGLRSRPRVAVIGGNRPEASSLRAAYRVGQLLAEKGLLLICGGLGGVMEEAARGCHEADGLSLGILPGKSLEEANKFIDIPVATGMGYNRNSMVVLNAEVVIAIDGEYGTLSEIAFARIFGKKIIGLNTWPIEGLIRANSPEEAVELALAEIKRIRE